MSFPVESNTARMMAAPQVPPGPPSVQLRLVQPWDSQTAAPVPLEPVLLGVSPVRFGGKAELDQAIARIE